MEFASSARAEKRNAFSGSSRLSVEPPSLSCPSAGALSRIATTSRRTFFTPCLRLGLRAGFVRDPLQVLRQSALHWDRDDLRKFVRVPLAQRLLQSLVALGRGLDQHRVLFVVLDRAFPAVHGAAGGEDVHAGREALLDQHVAQPLRGGAVGKVRYQ